MDLGGSLGLSLVIANVMIRKDFARRAIHCSSLRNYNCLLPRHVQDYYFISLLMG